MVSFHGQWVWEFFSNGMDDSFVWSLLFNIVRKSCVRAQLCFLPQTSSFLKSVFFCFLIAFSALESKIGNSVVMARFIKIGCVLGCGFSEAWYRTFFMKKIVTLTSVPCENNLCPIMNLLIMNWIISFIFKDNWSSYVCTPETNFGICSRMHVHVPHVQWDICEHDHTCVPMCMHFEVVFQLCSKFCEFFTKEVKTYLFKRLENDIRWLFWVCRVYACCCLIFYVTRNRLHEYWIKKMYRTLLWVTGPFSLCFNISSLPKVEVWCSFLFIQEEQHCFSVILRLLFAHPTVVWDRMSVTVVHSQFYKYKDRPERNKETIPHSYLWGLQRKLLGKCGTEFQKLCWYFV